MSIIAALLRRIANLSAAFRGLERALQIREAAAVAAGTVPDLNPCWRRMIFAQFHGLYSRKFDSQEVYAGRVPELVRLAQELAVAARIELASANPEAVGVHHVFSTHSPFPAMC